MNELNYKSEIGSQTQKTNSYYCARFSSTYTKKQTNGQQRGKTGKDELAIWD